MKQTFTFDTDSWEPKLGNHFIRTVRTVSGKAVCFNTELDTLETLDFKGVKATAGKGENDGSFKEKDVSEKIKNQYGKKYTVLKIKDTIYTDVKKAYPNELLDIFGVVIE